MTVLVTGVPGWLGNALIRRVGDRSLRALVLEGTDPAAVREVTSDIVFGDLRKPSTLQSAVKDVDTVFHLAAAHRSTRIRDFYEVNDTGTQNLLDACLTHGVERFIHVSSDAACGLSRGRPMTEQDVPAPVEDYGKSKLLGEQHVNRAHEAQGLKTTIIRPCWLYGPGMPKLTTGFLALVRSGRAPLFGQGLNEMSMAYIDNAVSGLLLAWKSKKAIGQTYFIADGRPYTMVEVYRAIAAAFGVPYKAVHLPPAVSAVSEFANNLAGKIGLNIQPLYSLGEYRHDRTCSIEKAKLELHYKPTTALDKGMKMAVEWCKARGMV